MQQNFYEFDEKIKKASEVAEKSCKEVFLKIEQIKEYNQLKVLRAFSDNRVSGSCFLGTDGYGYDDKGRDVLDLVFAQIMGTEDALVRHNFVSGTHAISTALFGVLRPNDTLLAVTGKPYDTLDEVIGLRGKGNGSLLDFGIKYEQIDLLPDKTPDYDKIKASVKGKKIAYIQRSRGYDLRPSLSIDTIEKIVKAVKEVSPNTIVMVDNCYGEFVETREPTEVGADIIIGSLIKNAGGGIAPTGGYIAGRRDLIELCAYRLTTVGTGKEVGCTLSANKPMYMGLFFAPTVVGEAVKSAIFASKLFEELGFEVYPKYDEDRTDIIQAVLLKNPEALTAFCQGIQKGAPVDAFVTPEAWDMPGYENPVIMAAGAFTMGSSIELSADAPMREPYAAWLQGGLTYYSAKAGIMLAAQSMLQKGYLK